MNLIGFMILNSAIAFGQFAEFSFDHKVQKSPPTKEGEILETDFSFTNTGDVPLIITEYKVECSCTQVIFPKEPIMPGESGVIEVRFDSDKKIGWQYRKIRLYANTKKSPTEIEIRVKVLNE